MISIAQANFKYTDYAKKNITNCKAIYDIFGT